MVILCPLLQIYVLCMFARFILSWFPPPREGPMMTVTGFLYTITEPVLRPVRGLIPPVGMIDISGMLVMFVLFGLLRVVC
jgi:YggT family protein